MNINNVNFPDYLKPQIEEIDKKINEAQKLLSDPAMTELAKEEIQNLEKQRNALIDSFDNQFSNETSKQTSNNSYNSCLLEFRPGPGGEEAKIWANELKRMYLRYSEKKGWKTSLIDDDVIKI